MARIRHIAIFAKDQLKMVEFYTKTFGMTLVHQHASESGEGRQAYYLSDGHINLAILPARAERPEGLDHFGFEIDDTEATARKALELGGERGTGQLPQDGRFAETFVRDPMGTRIDLSVLGWRTEPVSEPETASRRAG